MRKVKKSATRKREKDPRGNSSQQQLSEGGPHSGGGETKHSARLFVEAWPPASRGPLRAHAHACTRTKAAHSHTREGHSWRAAHRTPFTAELTVRVEATRSLDQSQIHLSPRDHAPPPLYIPTRRKRRGQVMKGSLVIGPANA